MEIHDSDILESIKKQTLYFIRPSQDNNFKLNKPLGSKLFTHLRVGLSHLKEHKFQYNLQDSIDLLCSCGNSIKPTIHFFLHCANYMFQRQTLLNKIHSIDPNVLALKETFVIKTLLFGKSDFRDSLSK